MKLIWQYRYAKFSLLFLFTIITLLQLFSFPGQFRHMKKQGVIELWQEVILTTLMAAILLSAQFALFCIWKIINLMQRDQFFSESSLHWFNLIVNSIRFASISALFLLGLILLQADDPGGPVLLTAITLFVSTLYILASLLREQVRIKVRNQLKLE